MLDSIKEKSVYTISPRPPALLLEVARGIATGEVFHSRMLEYEEEWPLVFLPLALMHESQLERLLASDLGLIYEWNRNASPDSFVDLPPEFLSCSYLNRADAEQVLAWASALHTLNDPVTSHTDSHVDVLQTDRLQVLIDESDIYEVVFRTVARLYSFVIAAKILGSDQYSCAFALCDQDGIPAHFGISRTGKQHQVLSTVTHLLENWIAKHRPRTISFIAREKSRERLYRRMARRSVFSSGYSEHYDTSYDGHTVFIFHRISYGPS